MTSHPHEVSPYFPAFLQSKTSQNSCLHLLSPLLYQSHNFFNLIESGSLSLELTHQFTVLLLLGPSVNTFNRVDHFLLLKAHCSLAFILSLHWPFFASSSLIGCLRFWSFTCFLFLTTFSYVTLTTSIILNDYLWTFLLGYPIGISNLTCSRWNSSKPSTATRWMVFAQTKTWDMLDLFLFLILPIQFISNILFYFFPFLSPPL